jgi:hypothetical protein
MYLSVNENGVASIFKQCGVKMAGVAKSAAAAILAQNKAIIREIMKCLKCVSRNVSAVSVAAGEK